ncbi:MAG TPA: tRNA (adenosine(37)-N6)-dimethylallyltransferase MiaA, partial [Candidatus Wallbacteria bacterium]|nr:tRNA (adenosine(37)-N6)-dimethylallyltransferase MiaA [Candidatus Wallbacteria bacterium]
MKDRHKKHETQTVPVIVGPTASGKTALAIKIAQKFDAEIISCDSRQIYKYMDIGTAKPSRGELDAVNHHLIDIITPDRSFSYADFAACAAEKIKEITGRKKLPLIVGGTGFYLDGLVNGISQIPEMDPSLTLKMRDELELKETPFLVSELMKLDMDSAARIKFNDRQRLVRAIIVSRLSGAPFSSY